MPYLDKIASYTPDRKNSYEVTIELKVRKMLEKHTDYRFEFRRTDDNYATDITAYRYEVRATGWSVSPIGFIEVEETPNWTNGIYPHNWRTYSYLSRKVLQYDRNTASFTDAPVNDAANTIYLKVARDLSDCHASLVMDIAQHHTNRWMDASNGLGAGEYNRQCLRFPINESNYVKRGISDCMNMILDFIK